ncbi:hydroxyethylthiazole kinase [Bacillus infantis]|uniref:hydroxyethylthiazole kinase n=1 Tax=Bacillus infantis TaxID=324767 RepID=UPI00344EA4C4
MNILDIAGMLEKLRAEKPLVHNITNMVVTNFTANGLLALGASPVMAHAAEEAADMAGIAGALVLNIGTLTSPVVESMKLAGVSAGRNSVPIILDPVGAGATAYRTETGRSLLEELPVSILRGNAAEISHLAGKGGEIKGVDGGEAGNPEHIAELAAKLFNTVTVVTGKEDIVSDGKTIVRITGGSSLLTKVTGTGCLLSSVIGAFHAIESDSLKAAAGALAVYSAAAEMAAEAAGSKGPGTFQIELLNSLALVKAEDLEKRAGITVLKGELQNGN